MEAANNLARQGEIYATGGYMRSPSRAVDGEAATWWSSGANEESTEFPLPAEWCVLWPRPTRISSIKILWAESALPKEFTVQASDDAHTWTDLLKQNPANEQFTVLKLNAPVETKYLRIAINAAANANGEVGIREVLVE
jgi:hypothetical protein